MSDKCCCALKLMVIFASLTKVIKLSCILLFSTIVLGQYDRGTLILSSHPEEVVELVKQGRIDLDDVREVTNFLTNRDIKTYKGHLIPKRKKAFIRHIKHISECLETMYQKRAVNDSVTYELLYELVLFEKSLIEKAKLNSKNGPGFLDKFKLWFDHQRSKWIFRFPIDKAPEKDIARTKNSPYWHQTQGKLYKHFGRLAKLKKIKAGKNMVVLFDKLSYSGSAPKIRAMDLDLDNEWSLKWGDEVHTDVVGSRIFAALGYDVDHPYYYEKDQLTLIFDGFSTVNNAEMLCDSMYKIYKIDLKQFIYRSGKINDEMITNDPELAPFKNQNYVRFIKCAIEGRPDRVKRIGPFLSNEMKNESRRVLRGALLAHAFIGNWDTSERNTLLTTVHDGNYNYRISAVYSDLGTGFGVKLNMLPVDFKVGLVNEFGWEVAEMKGNKVILNFKANTISKPFKEATYYDLRWMAQKIHDLDEKTLRKIINKSGWPPPIAELYFHKLASRRASILSSFNIEDQHPINFDKNLTIKENGELIVENGKLIVDYKRAENPESFLFEKGRFRNYGH